MARCALACTGTRTCELVTEMSWSRTVRCRFGFDLNPIGPSRFGCAWGQGQGGWPEPGPAPGGPPTGRWPWTALTPGARSIDGKPRPAEDDCYGPLRFGVRTPNLRAEEPAILQPANYDCYSCDRKRLAYFLRLGRFRIEVHIHMFKHILDSQVESFQPPVYMLSSRGRFYWPSLGLSSQHLDVSMFGF